METTQATDAVVCWCCGNRYQEDRVVRLGSHPEAAVCIGCAGFLHRRADALRPAAAPTRWLRSTAGAVRHAVMERGWHDKPVVGKVLRWLDRHQPW